MIPKVPTKDRGMATLGMTVAERLRRNRNMTITTRATVSISSNCTSFTEARIVVVRSVRIATLIEEGREALSCGNNFWMRSTTLMMLPGLPLNVHNDGGLIVLPGRLLDIFCAIHNLGHVGQADRRTVAISDDERAVRFARKKLIVRADDIRLPGTFQIALGLIDIRLRTQGAHILQAQVVEGERGRIRLDAHSGFLSTADGYQSNSRELGDFLRQDGV